MSQDELNKISQFETKAAKSLYNLKTHFSDTANPFYLFEMLFYTIAGFLLCNYMLNKIGSLLFLFISIIIYFIVVIFLRVFFHAVGKRFSDRIAYPMAPILLFLSAVTRPFIKGMMYLHEKVSGKDKLEDSRDEIHELLETSHVEGSIDTGEYRILKNVMNFSNVLVSDVMTPRTVIFSCHADKTVENIIKLPEIKMYSRFPIWEGESFDNGVLGYVLSKDVLHAAISGNLNKKVREFSRELYFIPENAELDKALERFLSRRQHLFIVVDEYGGVEGLLTMEDVLETMLGVEIVDEADRVVDLREFAKIRRDRRIASILKADEE